MLEELRTRAKELYDEKDYSEALKLYEVIKKSDEKYHEKFCLFHYIWCLYRVKINEQDAFSYEKFPLTKEYIKYMLRHQTNTDILYQMIVFKMIKHYKAKQNFDAIKINSWLDMLDPSVLPIDSYVITIEEKQIEQPSKKEEWYSMKSKVYEKLEMYNECLAISEEALKLFKPLHNNNKVWFKRRIAISKSKLGDPDEAIKLLTDMLRYRKDWFIYNDLSNIYFMLEDYKSAIHYAFDAVLRPGDDNKKINVFLSIVKILEMMKSNRGNVVKYYIIKLKLANEWKLSREEDSYYHTHKEIIDHTSKGQCRKQVINIANSYKGKNKEVEVHN